MRFTLFFTDRGNRDYFELKDNPSKAGIFKQVNKALSYLQTNPRHLSLNTHKFEEFSKELDKEVFEAYAQQNTPGAYRIFFYYSRKSEITIIAITPHP